MHGWRHILVLSAVAFVLQAPLPSSTNGSHCAAPVVSRFIDQPVVVETMDWRKVYGRPSRSNATPFATPLDDFYSGATLSPVNLDNWYGNGYNW
jgi:hypothetical protein